MTLIFPYVLAADLQNSVCSEKWVKRIAFNVYLITLVSYSFLLPTVLLAILYAKVVCGLIHENREINSFSTTPRSRNERLSVRRARNIRVSIVCITVVVVFLTSSIPSTIGWILFTYTKIIEYSQLQWM